MTAAVCLQCGAFKFGAFTPCKSCGFLPTSPEDQAKAIALSDHKLDQRTLKDISRRLAAGEKVQLNEEFPTNLPELTPMFVVRRLAKSLAKGLLVGICGAAIVYFLRWILD